MTMKFNTKAMPFLNSLESSTKDLDTELNDDFYAISFVTVRAVCFLFSRIHHNHSSSSCVFFESPSLLRCLLSISTIVSEAGKNAFCLVGCHVLCSFCLQYLSFTNFAGSTCTYFNTVLEHAKRSMLEEQGRRHVPK